MAKYSQKVEIGFAYNSFKWKNSAKDNAGVTVVIIGLQIKNTNTKRLFFNGQQGLNVKLTERINPYLSSGSDAVIAKRNTPLSEIPQMQNGSMPNDGGHLLISEEEHNSLPSNVKVFYKQIIGANEHFKDIKRYCLWLYDVDKNSYSKISEINEIIKRVRQYRLDSKRSATNKLAENPHLFGEIRYKESSSIIVPGLSSERREYIPIAFLKPEIIVSNLAQVIYEAESWLFGLVFSRINNTWVRATSGSLETRVRYSPILSYNTLPFPRISTQRKNEITQAVFRILEEREKHSDKTLAQLYDPDKMPEGLREAHRQNDEIIEKCYRSTPFKSDEERLEYLFKLYEKMIAEEKEQGSLFEKTKKVRKKRK